MTEKQIQKIMHEMGDERLASCWIAYLTEESEDDHDKSCASCSLDWLYDKRQPVDLDELQQERDSRP